MNFFWSLCSLGCPRFPVFRINQEQLQVAEVKSPWSPQFDQAPASCLPAAALADSAARCPERASLCGSHLGGHQCLPYPADASRTITATEVLTVGAARGSGTHVCRLLKCLAYTPGLSPGCRSRPAGAQAAPPGSGSSRLGLICR